MQTDGNAGSQCTINSSSCNMTDIVSLYTAFYHTVCYIQLFI